MKSKSKLKKSDLIAQYSHFNTWIPNEYADKLIWIKKHLKEKNTAATMCYLIHFCYGILKQQDYVLNSTDIAEAMNLDISKGHMGANNTPQSSSITDIGGGYEKD